MDARNLLQLMRDGHMPDRETLQEFGKALGTPAISDAQIGAFAMAICLQGLSPDARVGLTMGMRDSGDVMTWDLPGKVLDKHSTGGVGDAVSLLLAPMLAAVGVYVPMISGRGLGHTGGTLDKLESIPGVRCDLSDTKFRNIVSKVGCAIVAPSRGVAPADARLYAVRDVTGTVRSIDLITSSILSKKLAAGLDGLVLDVKTGSGAVMQNIEDAKLLANSLVSTANGAGCPCSALITNMNQPVLSAIGNGLEIADVLRCFQIGSGRLVDLSIELGTELLVNANAFYTEKGARDALTKALTDGSAREIFGKMISMQGGPANFCERWQDYLEISPAYTIQAGSTGYVSEINGVALGLASVELGAGRKTEKSKIDPSVGISQIVPLGAAVSKGEALCHIHARNATDAQAIALGVSEAFVISDNSIEEPELILEKVTI